MEDDKITLPIEYVSDLPIQNPEQDQFNRWPFAQKIAQTIINRKDTSNMVISILGPWGDGKTSILNLIEYALKKTEFIIPIKFNPWRFEDDKQLIMMFFSVLKETLNINLGGKEKIGEILEKYAEIIFPLDISGPGVSIPVGGTLTKVGRMMSGNNPETLKTKFEGILRDNEKCVVIFMDDIDRLDKDEIHAVFKLVKLTAGFDNLIYILAFDDRMVASALTDKYGNNKDDLKAGYSFLEKIVQIPIKAPQIPRFTLLEFFELEVNNALNDSNVTFNRQMLQPYWQIIINDLSVRITTPRLCKRYANMIRLATTMLKYEVNLVDLLLIEAIRIFYPQLYDSIKNNSNLFLGTHGFLESTQELGKNAQNVIDEVLKPYNEIEKVSAKSLITFLFPQIPSILSEMDISYPVSDEWYKEKRISSVDYFQRYFSYSVPKDDVSDNRIDNFITSISKLEVEDIVKELHSIIDKKNVNKVLFKLMPYKDKVRNNNSLKLSKALSEIGDLLPTSSESTFVRSPQYLASSLIHDLLLNAKTEDAFYSTIMDIIEKSEPVTYSLKCFYEITNDDKSKPDKSLLLDTQIKELNALLIFRIKTISNLKTLYIEYGKEAEELIWYWYNWGDKEELTRYLHSTFSKDHYNVVIFLSIFLTTIDGLNNRKTGKVSFRRETFDKIINLIDPQVLITHLKSVYGDKLDKAEKAWLYEAYDIDDKEKVAFQFAAYYNTMLKEKATESGLNKDNVNGKIKEKSKDGN
ncbi:MAG: P-loop NTPase fold protein [bacterium]